MSGNANAARVVAIMGSTGSGKTTALRAMLAKPKRKRTIVWSPKEAMDNYAALFPGSQVVTTATQALHAARAAGAGPLHLVFKPRLNRKVDEGQFDAVCRIALAARNVCMIVDELHTVTKPSWAPDGWSQLVMMGRAYGCEVFGLSQRPASMDKDFLSNCTTIRTGRLAYADDAKAVGRSLNVDPGEVLALTGFQFIQRDTLTGKMLRG